MTYELVESPTPTRIQEWLCLNGHGVVVDGVIGPASKSAIADFQLKRGIVEKGAGPKTWAALTEPLARAIAPITPTPGNTLSQLVAQYAEQQLKEHPREVGGSNKGPWVRLYMRGNQGAEWPWCAGFAMFCVSQAAKSLGIECPLPYAFGCDYLGGVAAEQSRLLLAKPEPGYLFLLRKAKRPAKRWSHVGIVVSTDRVGTMGTIEGNTNDDGSPEGFEVCRRTRAIASSDFIRL